METNLILIVSTLLLAGAGAFSAFMGWLKSNEAFDAKKFASGVVTGVIAGVGLTIANATGLTSGLDATQTYVLLGTLVLSVIGVDNFRTAVSGSIANRAVEEKVEEPQQ